ncbi:unnamed protein product [Closterium sp. NIES-65]|nr:unnamed protein product [Closterium sp. NIES-65]
MAGLFDCWRNAQGDRRGNDKQGTRLVQFHPFILLYLCISLSPPHTPPTPHLAFARHDLLTPPPGERLFTFTIVTTASSQRLQWLHDRMPAILPSQHHVAAWLHGKLSGPDAIAHLCSPYNHPDLVRPILLLSPLPHVWHAVTPEVGKPAFNGPQCVQPISLKPALSSTPITQLFARKRQKTPPTDAVGTGGVDKQEAEAGGGALEEGHRVKGEEGGSEEEKQLAGVQEAPVEAGAGADEGDGASEEQAKGGSSGNEQQEGAGEQRSERGVVEELLPVTPLPRDMRVHVSQSSSQSEQHPPAPASAPPVAASVTSSKVGSPVSTKRHAKGAKGSKMAFKPSARASARGILAGDAGYVRALGEVARWWAESWRVPLQYEYDPADVAHYFNRRPHIVLLRTLKISVLLAATWVQVARDTGAIRAREAGGVSAGDERIAAIRQHSALKLKRTLLRLGPTFIKVAQSLSARPDVVGPDTAKVLAELQDRLPAFPSEDAMAVIERELGRPAAALFPLLSPTPVAAASFGQVYKGRTRDGMRVAVKVQRPRVLFLVARDIHILRMLRFHHSFSCSFPNCMLSPVTPFGRHLAHLPGAFSLSLPLLSSSSAPPAAGSEAGGGDKHGPGSIGGRVREGAVWRAGLPPGSQQRHALRCQFCSLLLPLSSMFARLLACLLSALADEFGRGLYGELDYRHEATNATLFAVRATLLPFMLACLCACVLVCLHTCPSPTPCIHCTMLMKAHAHLPGITVPAIRSDLTSRRVLTMEWVEGERTSDLLAQAQPSPSAFNPLPPITPLPRVSLACHCCADPLQKAHAHLPGITVPAIRSDLTSRRVLTMEWVEGERTSDLLAQAQGVLGAAGGEEARQRAKQKLLRMVGIGVESSLEQLLVTGVLHADPHPGNLLLTPQGQVAYLDFDLLCRMERQHQEAMFAQVFAWGHLSGLWAAVSYGAAALVLQIFFHLLLPPLASSLTSTLSSYLDFGLLCRMERQHQQAMLAAVAHLVNGEWSMLAADLAAMDVLKPTTDRRALTMALEEAFGRGRQRGAASGGAPTMQFGQVTSELWRMALRFRFRLPPYYTLVLRSLASLEEQPSTSPVHMPIPAGIGVAVDPSFRVFASAYPYVVRRLLTDSSPSSRHVLRQLVQTREGKLRWERFASFAASSTQAQRDLVASLAMPSLQSPIPGMPPMPGASPLSSSSAATAGAASPRATPSPAALVMDVLLSRHAASARRVILESDMRALAEAFVSPEAEVARDKLARVVADALCASLGVAQLPLDAITASQLSSSPTRLLAPYPPPPPACCRSGIRHEWEEREGRATAAEAVARRKRLWLLLGAAFGRMGGSVVLKVRVVLAALAVLLAALGLALKRVLLDAAMRFRRLTCHWLPSQDDPAADQPAYAT